MIYQPNQNKNKKREYVTKIKKEKRKMKTKENSVVSCTDPIYRKERLQKSQIWNEGFA